MRWIAQLMVVVATAAGPAAEAADADKLTFLDQGWTPADRQQSYLTPPGSQLLPYDWFLALEQPFAAKPFRDRDFLEGFQLLWDAPNPAGNPDGLPLGFLKDTGPKGTAFVGATCAVCHTAEIHFNGARLRIDGGPGLVGYSDFREAFTDALRATDADPGKMARFAERVLGPKHTKEQAVELRQQVRAYAEGFADFCARNRPVYMNGFGRIDGFTMLINEILGTALGEPDNYRSCAAPVSIPSLWGSAQLDWLQWNASVQNPTARNIVEILAVYGHAGIGGKGQDLHFSTTANLKNLNTTWQLLARLKPPAWPEDILGAIDRNKAGRGEAVYRREKCAECHAERPPYPLTDPNEYGKRFVKIAKTSVAKVGTDPTAAADFVNRTARAGRLAPLVGGKETLPAYELFFVAVGGLTTAGFEQAGLTDAQKLEYSGFHANVLPGRAELLAYKAAPLAGVWATAPYLHNGSVPNLYQLLLPPEERIKTFHVGGRAFDPKHVGYVTDHGPERFEFRTTVPGNGNAGHAYGTKISDRERWDLVEFLKTL